MLHSTILYHTVVYSILLYSTINCTCNLGEQTVLKCRSEYFESLADPVEVDGISRIAHPVPG